MLVAKQGDVAKHLVAEEYHVVAASQGSNLLQLFFAPHYTNGVLRVTDHHELRFLLFEYTLQVVKVHAIEMVAGGHKVVAHSQTTVALNHILEVVVHRFLQHYAVAWLSEKVEYHSQGRHTTRHECQLFTAYFEAVAAALPIDNRLPVFVIGKCVAIDGMIFETRNQCVTDFGAYSKVHIGNPQGQQVVTSKK